MAIITTLTGSVISVVADADESYTSSLRTGSVAGPVVATKSFAVNNTSLSTHKNTDWQIASDAGFATIVYQSMADTVNKTSITVTTLNEGTTYYARHRYRLNDNTVSAYSNQTFVTTAGSGLNSALNKNGGSLSTEGTLTTASANSDGYDWLFRINSNGTLTVGDGVSRLSP